MTPITRRPELLNQIHAEKAARDILWRTKAKTVAGEPDMATRWGRVRGLLKTKVGKADFDRWLECCLLEKISGNTAHFSVPDTSLMERIKINYSSTLLSLIAAEFPGVTRSVIHVRVAPPPPQVPEPRVPCKGSPANPRRTFESFYTDSHNRLAVTEARRCLTTPVPVFNPIYIYGGSGLGKTHLLQAIASAGDANHVLYLTAARFMCAGVQEQILAMDVVLIDDIQFLPLRGITRGKFIRMLASLLDANKQVVLTGDCHPNAPEIDEKIQERLGGGLCLEIAGFDEELRTNIIKACVADARKTYPTFEIPDEVISYVASAIRTNGRSLCGAVKRLLVYASVHGFDKPLQIETAKITIHDLATAPYQRITVNDIQRLVSCHFDVSIDDLVSARRASGIVLPRHVAMYMSRILTPHSFPEIGRLFGGRDHTTILHAVRKIDELRKTDPELNDGLYVLTRKLKNE